MKCILTVLLFCSSQTSVWRLQSSLHLRLENVCSILASFKDHTFVYLPHRKITLFQRIMWFEDCGYIKSTIVYCCTPAPSFPSGPPVALQGLAPCLQIVITKGMQYRRLMKWWNEKQKCESSVNYCHEFISSMENLKRDVRRGSAACWLHKQREILLSSVFHMENIPR